MKRIIKPSEIKADPLARYSDNELHAMSGPQLRKLFFGDGHERKPGVMESYTKRMEAFRKS
jgi:hypothetical protein